METAPGKCVRLAGKCYSSPLMTMRDLPSHSGGRTAIVDRRQQHYNSHRPHQGIGGIALMTRLNKNTNNPSSFTSSNAGHALKGSVSTTMQPNLPSGFIASVFLFCSVYLERA